MSVKVSPPDWTKTGFQSIGSKNYRCPAGEYLTVTEVEGAQLLLYGWALGERPAQNPVNTTDILAAGGALSRYLGWNWNAFVALGDSRIADRYAANTRYYKRGLGHNWWHHANSLLGGRMFDAGCFAYSGQTSEEYLGYKSAPLPPLTAALGFASNVEAAFSTNAGWLEIWGIINDIAALPDANVLSKDFWNLYIKPIVLRWIARGGKVIIHSETGAVNFSNKANYIAAMLKYNQQAKEFCLMSGGNAIYHDIYSQVVDPTLTGNNHGFLAGLSADGVHFSNHAARDVIGESFAALMDPLIPKISFLPVAANIYSVNSPNRFPNPLFTNQTGGAASADITSGTLPQGLDGYNARTGDGGTVQAGRIKLAVANEASANGRGRQLNMTFNATADACAQFVHNINVAAGEKYYAIMEVDVVSGNLDGASVLCGMELQFATTVNGVANPVGQGYVYVASDGAWQKNYKKYVIMTPVCEIPPGTLTASTLRFSVFTNAAGRPQIIIRQLDYFRVQE